MQWSKRRDLAGNKIGDGETKLVTEINEKGTEITAQNSSSPLCNGAKSVILQVTKLVTEIKCNAGITG